MEKKSFLAGIAASALVVGGGFAGMAAVNAQQAPSVGQGETVMSESVNVPAGDYAPEVLEAEAVAPAPEPEVTVAPVEPVEAAPAPVVAAPVEAAPAPAPVEAAPPAPGPETAPTFTPIDPADVPARGGPGSD